MIPQMPWGFAPHILSARTATGLMSLSIGYIVHRIQTSTLRLLPLTGKLACFESCIVIGQH